MNNTHWVAFGLFALFQFFSIGTFFDNIIKKKRGSLNFAPAFFFFCGFLYFSVFYNHISLIRAVIYLILLLSLNLMLGTLNEKMTQSYRVDSD